MLLQILCLQEREEIRICTVSDKFWPRLCVCRDNRWSIINCDPMASRRAARYIDTLGIDMCREVGILPSLWEIEAILDCLSVERSERESACFSGEA